MSPQIIQQQPKIIGVTGTNGKTSITHFIARALLLSGLKTGVIGTVGNGLIDHLQPARLTTPSPDEYKKLMDFFISEKTDVVAVEASSHGLVQGRLKGTDFFAGIFTNLTQDHLDYHKTMAEYEAAKFKLFTDYNTQHNIINIDDPTGLKFATLLKSKQPYCTSVESQKNHLNTPFIFATNITPHKTGTTAKIHTPWGTELLETHLFGKFNISNLLAVVALLGIMNIPLSKIMEYIAQLKSVTGRMQLFHFNSDRPTIVIDYAHTPDALEKTLKTLREHCDGNIWCVFGCGGDRDKTKRPLMGRIAEQLADFVILTDDNPRTEKPLDIIADIKAGILDKKNIVTEHDRRRAIQHAIESAKVNDMVLIAGKGHETYQEIGHERFPFSDELEVKLLCCSG